MKNTHAHINISAKKLKKLIFCLTFILLTFNNVQGQRANNWYFPAKKSLTFNTNPPSPLGNSQCFYGGAASISDNQGNLLFYSDARRVFDKNGQIMPNGDNIKGASNSTVGSDQALIIPHPALQNLYYLFTNETNEGALPTGYYYHLIDMNANGGLGDVVLKNQLLYSNSGMRMTAAPMADGAGVWFISMEYRKKILHNYKITCQGLNSTPVLDTLDANFNGDYFFDGGDMKASTSGNILAFGCYSGSINSGTTELYKFNKQTGKTVNKLVLPLLSYKCEFSPNDKYLYFGGNLNFNFYQLDISSFDSATIFNNRVIIGQGTGCQLGPDGRIYILNLGDTLFSYIEKPNLPYPACNFINRILPIEGNGPSGSNSVFYGILPFFLPSLLANQNVQIPSYTVASDCRTVTLTGKTYIKGLNLTFKWKFDDGDSTVQTVASGGDTTFTTVTHFFPLGVDTFNVQLFVTSDTVCGQGSAGKKVVVKPPKPTAKFGFVASCNNAVVSFKDSSLLNFNPSITYQWRFFNKQNVLLGSSSLQNPVYTFPTLDTFFAQLIVRSSLACVQADTLLKTIVLKAKPVAGFSYANACGSLAASFTNTSSITTDSLQGFTWLFGDGNSAILKNPTNTYTSYGSYTVKLVVTSAQGCVSDTFSLPVNIKAKPVANFIYSNNGCAGLPVLLQDSSYVTNSTISGHYWLLPNGNSYNTVHINPVFAVGNSYAIKYVVSSSLGCVSDTLVKPVLIESIPVAAINPATVGGCVNQALALQDASTIAVGQITAWAWQVGSQTSAAQNPSFSFSTASNYTAQLVVTSKNGCVSNTASKPFTIESKPVAAFTNGLVCLEKPVSFTNTSTNSFGAIAQTAWFLNNSLVSNNNSGFTYTFNQGGSYYLLLQVSTANGCTDTTGKTLIVDPAPISAGRDTVVRQGEPFVLQGSGGINFLWQPFVGLDDPNKQYPTGILNQSQQYTLTVTTAQGCVGYDTVQVTVLRNLIIPNAFSPNGDGINETWNIEQLKDYPNAELQLFSRNGQLLYSVKGNNIAAWNGQVNGKPVPVGTYYYIITLNNQLRNKPFTGWVLVVR